MFKNNVTIIILLVIILLLVGGYAFKVVLEKRNSVNSETVAIFEDVEDITEAYSDIDGKEESLEKYLGKNLVVTSWASWSPFSKDDLINLNELAIEYNGKEVVFIAINRKETKEQAQRFLNKLPELNSLVVVLDPRDHFYNSIAGYAMPETVIYDRKGNIVKRINGKFEVEEIRDYLNELVL